MTLSGVMAVIMRYFTKLDRLWWQLHQNK